MEEDKITIPSNSIDKITLEYLMNKKQYKKYVSKTNPEKYIQNEIHLNKIYNYKSKILEMTNDLLNDPECQITLDVNESFDNYMRTLIRYFETKEMEKSDNDTLFEKIDDFSNKKHREPEPDPELHIEEEPVKKSYWGLQRVIKKTQMQTSLPFHKQED
jgi:hypothetical protein